jgi:hypothetical protein
MLRRRRELVVLSAELQRATITRRLERIDVNPARRLLGAATAMARRPAALKIGSALLAFAIRTWRRRRELRRRNRYQPAL